MMVGIMFQAEGPAFDKLDALYLVGSSPRGPSELGKYERFTDDVNGRPAFIRRTSVHESRKLPEDVKLMMWYSPREECAELLGENGLCPMCRATVTSWERVYV